MIVQLSIADDRELRAHIWDVIKGEIVSIARGEIRAIIAEVVKEGVIPKTPGEIDKLVKESVVSLTKDALMADVSGHFNNYQAAVREIAREEVKAILDKMFRSNFPL